MQIFLKSLILFSFLRKQTTRTKGFTLVELLISVAIIGLVTTVVLVRNGSFQGTVLLKSAAYEIALSLREAQIKSVSSTRSSGSFNYPYGLTFTPSQASYTAFQYPSEDTTLRPRFDDSSYPANVIQTLLVGSTLQVYDVCINYGSGDDCSPTRLDVSFRRPEFKSLFYAAGYGGSPANIQSAKVKIRSLAGNATVFVVEISQLGQISVSKE